MRIYHFGQYEIHVWPDDHGQVHCHVFIADISELKIFLPDMRIELKWGRMPPTPVLEEIKKLVWISRKSIGKQWRIFHGN